DRFLDLALGGGVLPLAALADILRPATLEVVPAGLAEKRVLATAARELVLAGAAAEDVLGGQALDRVLAAEPGEHGGAVGAGDPALAGGADLGRGPAAAADRNGLPVGFELVHRRGRVGQVDLARAVSVHDEDVALAAAADGAAEEDLTPVGREAGIELVSLA